MKADKIRELGKLFRERNGKELETITDGSATTVALMEIAAQLAEVKEFLEIYTNPPMVFGGTDIDPAALDDALQNLPQPILTAMEPRLTLRDRFAMAAMSGNWVESVDADYNSFAKWAYKIADDMMEARK
jgi:hypothetical protein